ncbi:lysylphosphatidylglycerol synthase domain-containing protein [Mycoplasmopsis equigenitalium]|uniref:Lysylphosphatidylglycerol synthase domain-containing protein n=1 Tax=Mycoplasmopsis equigenitalium TaxID=114883 RepID=A0ABY5J1R0_9BACT|nr:lysylphosphatidylglycerol synthase domain-containing protein [Mycoplasmopsis equigenitalium]UUD36654.1 lysylphosphatidylglycerol synthase domain-containing protein [Mycoplasmopsis equigenitalium]
MSLNPLYQKWKNTDSEDENFLDSLLRLNKNKKNINETFSKGIKFINNKIVAKMGAGTNLINEYTITNIAQSYITGIEKSNNIKLEDTNGILVFFDNARNAELYSNIIARVFSDNNIKTHFISDSKSLPHTLANYTVHKNNLFGAIVLTKNVDSKDVIELAFYKKDGYHLSKKEIMAISFAMNQTNYLSLNLPSEIISYQMHHVRKTYLQDVISSYAGEQINKDIKVALAFNNRDTKDFYKFIFEKLNLKINFSNNIFFRVKTDFNNAKSMNNAMLKAKVTRSHFAMLIDHNGRGVNIAVRIKKRLRYLTPGEISTLYLKYQRMLENHKFNILNHYTNGSLTKRLAKKYNYNYEEFSEYRNAFETSDADFIAANKNKFYLQKFCYTEYDGLLFVLDFLKMVTYFQKQNLSIDQILSDLETENGFYHDSYKSERISHEAAHRFFNRIKNLTEIKKVKILNIEDISLGTLDTNNKVFKIVMDNNINLILTYSILNKRLSTHLNIISTKNQTLNQMVLLEREILEELESYKETNEVKKITFSNVFKYTFYAALLIGVFVFLFNIVWKMENSGTSILENMRIMIFQSQGTRWAFLSFIGLTIINILTSGLVTVRIMNYQGHKIKLYHAAIASFLGVVVQNITPKSVGSEIAFYWYLRRKGYDKSALLATVFASGIVWQLSNFLMTIIFAPIGLSLYWDHFSTNNANTIIFIIFLIVGLLVDTIIAAVVFIVTLSIKIQVFIVNHIIAFFQWFLFTNVYDPRTKAAKYIHDFAQIRNGIKIVFNKWWKILELVIYKWVPWILSGLAIFILSYKNAGQTILDSSKLKGGPYMTIFSALTLSRIANSFSITPGGNGTYEYFAKTLFSDIFIDTTTATQGLRNTKNDWASITTAINSIGGTFIPTLFSALLFCNIGIGEKLIDIRNKKIKNDQLINNQNTIYVQKKSVFYLVSLIIWIVALSVGLIVFVAY